LPGFLLLFLSITATTALLIALIIYRLILAQQEKAQVFSLAKFILFALAFHITT
jgi:hypothetical protein